MFTARTVGIAFAAYVGAQPYVISDADIAQPFWGIGAISGGGATSRLLFDYEQNSRDVALDFLFKPQYGASLHQIKVEIPGDADTTCGSEPSHQHDAGDGGSYRRGYEGWILSEARKRNPDILTSALVWAAPSFIGDPAISNGTTIFTPAGARYITQWVQGIGAEYGPQNVSLDVLGAGWNEHPHNNTWIKLLRGLLNSSGLPPSSVRIAASDEWNPSQAWQIGLDMAADTALRQAVDVISTHVAGYMDHQDPAPATVLSLGVPIWQGEEHFALPDPNPAPAWSWEATAAQAVEINQNWARNGMSATVMWPVSYSWYKGLIYPGKGFISTTSPWAETAGTGAAGGGNGGTGGQAAALASIGIMTPLWVTAHTTHFTPGPAGSWSLLNGTGSGFIDPASWGTNISYVTYLSPPRPAPAGQRDVTIVLESMSWGLGGAVGAHSSMPSQPVPVTFLLSGSLLGWCAGRTLNVWHTNSSVTFAQADPIAVAADGTIHMSIEPMAVYTLTSVTSSNPGAAALMAAAGVTYCPASPPPEAAFPLPYADNFQGYANDTLPLYFSDMYGAWSVWHPDSELGRSVDASASSLACATGEQQQARPGRCSSASSSTNSVLRQWVREPPIGWGSSAGGLATILGNYSLQSTALSLQVLIDTPEAFPPPFQPGQERVYIGLRGGKGCAGCTSPRDFYSDSVDAYTWTLWANGTWAVQDDRTPLASGVLSQPFGYDTWHTLAFSDASIGSGGVTLVGQLDGQLLFTLPITSSSNSSRVQVRTAGGYVVLGTGIHRAQWDNLSLQPL